MLANKNKKIDIERLLVLFGTGITICVIGSFGVFRFLQGEIGIAITDFVISVPLALLFFQTLQNKKYEFTNPLLVATYTVGLFVLLNAKGIGLSYWLYCATAGTFFLLNLKTALIVNIISISASMLILIPHLTTYQFINIGTSSVLLCMFGYAFSARASLHAKELSLLATQDPLTKVGNRRSLDERIKEEVISFKEDQQSCSIMIFDLDHFKKVNDEFGHAAGDDVLVDFVKILKSSTRLSDVIYRYGGEEFVIISNHMELESAGKFADYLRELVSENLKVGDRNLTVSVGVSEITTDDSEESWFHRADLALYEAKNANRNLVYLATKDTKKQSYSYRVYKEVSIVDANFRNVERLLPLNRNKKHSRRISDN